MNKKYLAALVTIGLTSVSCGKVIDAATDKVVEEGLEQAIESDTGENVELDLNLDDGEITITGEDGEEIKIDADDDKITITGTDEEGNEENVEITGDDDGVNIDSDDGDLSYGSDLPEDWPSEWGFPSGVIVIGGGKLAEGSRTSFTATFESNDNLDEVVDFYSNLSVSDDVTATSQTTSDGYTSFYQAWGNDEEGETAFVNVAETGGLVTGTVFISVEN